MKWEHWEQEDGECENQGRGPSRAGRLGKGLHACFILKEETRETSSHTGQQNKSMSALDMSKGRHMCRSLSECGMRQRD